MLTDFGNDLFASVAVVAIWTLILGRETLMVLAGLSVARLVLKFVVLMPRVFAPLHLWLERGPRLEERELLELEPMLLDCSRRHTIFHALGWLGQFLLTVVLLELWVEPDAGLAEYGLASLLLLSLLAGAGMMLVSVLRPLLQDVRAELGAQLSARGLDAQRQASSFVDEIVLLNSAYVLAVYFGVAALGGAVQIDSWRDLHAAEARELARAAANASDTSLAEGIEYVARLPDALADAARERETSGELALPSVIERSAGLAHAAAPVPGGWLVATVESDEQVPWLFGTIALLPLLFGFSLASANRRTAGAVARQLREVSEATGEVLGSGKLRGVRRFRPADNNEAGRLLLDFNGLIDVLGGLADTATRVAEGDLAVEFEHRGELHAAFGGMLEQLRAMVGSMQAAAAELSVAARNIQAIATEHEQLTNRQSLRVSEVGETTVQLASTAADIALSATEVLTDAERTVNTSAETLARITALSEQAGGIREVLEVISDVAERSDLLALNGALEATRAGEAGRGFMLVANEMRRLAERTAGSVSDVHARVEGITNSSASSVSAMSDSRKLATRTAKAALDISALTETQRKDTERVSAAMQVLAESVAATATATLQTLEAAEGLRTQASALEVLTQRWSSA